MRIKRPRKSLRPVPLQSSTLPATALAAPAALVVGIDRAMGGAAAAGVEAEAEAAVAAAEVVVEAERL